MPVRPYNNYRQPAECVIEVAGEEIAGYYPDLISALVNRNRHDATVAELVFAIFRDENGSWSLLDEQIFKPWEKVCIKARFGMEGDEEVMRGYVRSLATSFTEPGQARLTIKCQDESYLLDRQQNRKSWRSQGIDNDQDLVNAIITSRGFTGDISPGQSNITFHQNDTDIAFLRQRARANGYELMFSEGHVYFGPMRLSGEPQPTLLVDAGSATNCSNLNVEINSHNPEQVAFEIADKQRNEQAKRHIIKPNLPLLGLQPVENQTTEDDYEWLLNKQTGNSVEQTRILAQTKANEFSLRVKATGEIDSIMYGHVLQPGHVVGIDGVGELLGGRYYVDEVEHHFSNDNYIQKCTLLRNGQGDDLSQEQSLSLDF